jgi:hypothetical protein
VLVAIGTLPQLQGQEADGEGVTENATTETAGDEHVEELLPASLHPGMCPHELNHGIFQYSPTIAAIHSVDN